MWPAFPTSDYYGDSVAMRVVRRDERGFAMVIAIGALMIVVILACVAALQALSSSDTANRSPSACTVI